MSLSFAPRKKGYATTFVDLVKHKVFDAKLGRSEPSLRSHFSGLKDRDKVQVMVMDLSETYRSIAKKYFPNATMVADRFHTHSGHRCGAADQSSLFRHMETAR